MVFLTLESGIKMPSPCNSTQQKRLDYSVIPQVAKDTMRPTYNSPLQKFYYRSCIVICNTWEFRMSPIVYFVISVWTQVLWKQRSRLNYLLSNTHNLAQY